ncbi:MAG: hypothetical protein IJI25_07760 [Eubacterium sp.]|nr:hypothetical protein [Eubacterium sp.]
MSRIILLLTRVLVLAGIVLLLAGSLVLIAIRLSVRTTGESASRTAASEATLGSLAIRLSLGSGSILSISRALSISRTLSVSGTGLIRWHSIVCFLFNSFAGVNIAGQSGITEYAAKGEGQHPDHDSSNNYFFFKLFPHN